MMVPSQLSIEDIETSLKAMKQQDLLTYATNINKKLDELYKVSLSMFWTSQQALHCEGMPKKSYSFEDELSRGLTTDSPTKSIPTCTGGSYHE